MKYLLVAVLCLHVASAAAQPRFNLKRAPKIIQDKVGTVTETIETVKRLIALSKMTTAEFNKKVSVQKGTNGKKYSYTGKNATGITKPEINDGGEFTNLEWKAVTYFHKQLFPAEIISMSRYKGKLEGRKEAISRPLGFRIISSKANIPINWEIECDNNTYFKKVSGYVLYKEADKELDLMPEIPWNYAMLGKQLSTVPITVTFRLFDHKGRKAEIHKTMTVRSINDCIYRYKDLDLNFLFAAFIQEEHPEIEKIKKEALNTKLINSICGYQQGEEYVHKQVAAIWAALHNRGFKYSSSTTTGSGDDDDDISCQAVRTFANAIKTNQANCVDGTIVFASILRKMGIYTALMLTPDHCFLGYYTDKEKTNIAYLETTMLSESKWINKAKDNKNEGYMKQFELAREEGQDKYDKYSRHKDLIKIDVDASRKYVKPIPF